MANSTMCSVGITNTIKGHQFVQQAASLHGVSVSQFYSDAAIKEARRILRRSGKLAIEQLPERVKRGRPKND
jgi:uncharacterized protein (DUF1778 family)